MKKSNKSIKVKPKITKCREIVKLIDGKPENGYIEIEIKYGAQWRRIFFKIEN